MKKTYMKPIIKAIEIKHYGILCVSPGQRSVQVFNDEDDKITDEEYVW